MLSAKLENGNTALNVPSGKSSRNKKSQRFSLTMTWTVYIDDFVTWIKEPFYSGNFKAPLNLLCHYWKDAYVTSERTSTATMSSTLLSLYMLLVFYVLISQFFLFFCFFRTSFLIEPDYWLPRQTTFSSSRRRKENWRTNRHGRENLSTWSTVSIVD